MPLEGATVIILPSGQIALTDQQGRFIFNTTGQFIRISAIGHNEKTISFDLFLKEQNILLERKTTSLEQVTVSGNRAQPYRSISSIDIAMRGIDNSQEVLRLVPGLFIG